MERTMSMTIEQALQLGISAHRESKLTEAEGYYRAILKKNPQHAHANHNLGVLAVSVGKTKEALPFFKKALDQDYNTIQFHVSYIEALIKIGETDKAEQVLTAAKEHNIAHQKLEDLQNQIHANANREGPSDHLSITDQKTKPLQPLSEAVRLRESGKYSEAIALLDRHIAAEPDDAEALTLLSQLLMLTGRIPESELSLTKAESIDPTLPSLLRNQARLSLLKSEPAKALKKAKSLCAQAPDDLENQLLLSACLGANKNNREAFLITEKVLASRPNYAEAFANRALLKFRAKDLVSAINDAKMAVKFKPHLTQIWSLLGTMYYQNNNIKEAIEALKNALKIEPENVAFMMQLGEFSTLGDKTNDAINIYKKATNINPNNTLAWTKLAMLLHECGQTKDAITAYKKSLDLDPNSAQVLSNLGAIEKNAGEINSALEYFERALVINPKLAEIHNNKGIILKDLGRLDEALKSFKKAVKLKPDLDQTFCNLGNILTKVGKLNEAEKNCRQAIFLNPEYADAHNNLGIALQQLGRSEAATESYKRAIGLNPSFAIAYHNLGTLNAEQNSFEEAEKSYKQALKLDPALAITHFVLGNMLKRNFKYSEAEKSYAHAIKLEPDLSDAHKSQLTCLYMMNEESRFYKKLDYLIALDEANAVTGSLTQRAALKYGTERKNIFCKEPFKYVQHTNLDTKVNFEKTFVKKAKLILQKENISNRIQSLLVNGTQTHGNIFKIESDNTSGIEKIIREAIESYRASFLSSQEGLIKKWPTDYILYGWIISMKNGGKLKPHIHEEGWLSGSVYINVPPKLKPNSGNLVVCLGEEKDVIDGSMNSQKSINVSTGSLVLFPGSLMHYTIPFESDEDRIVLAFDVREKEGIETNS
jgi:tetratricopeptide (TPR) repeat protein